MAVKEAIPLELKTRDSSETIGALFGWKRTAEVIEEMMDVVWVESAIHDEPGWALEDILTPEVLAEFHRASEQLLTRRPE